MAIQFLHDIDLNGQEIKNAKMHVTSSAPTAALGAMYYDSGNNVLKYYSNAGWQTISNDTTDDNTQNQYSTSVVDSSGIKLRLSGSGHDGNTTDDVKFAGAGTVTVSRTDASTITITGAAESAGSASSAGTIKLFSDTTQTVAAESVSATNGRTYGLQIDSSGRGVVNVPWTDSSALTTEEVQDIVGGMVSSNTESGITVTYDDAGSGTGKLNFSVASQTDNNFTNADHSKLDGIEASADVTDTGNVKDALNASLGSATFGDSNDTITIPGNLVVTGDTTYSNETIQIVTDNTLAFRAGDGDSNEVLLTAANATGGDKTITLPNLSGHIALLASAAGGTITATPTELNVLDGFTGATADLTYAKDLRATGVTTTEFDYLDGVTSNIQTQLNAKQASGTYNTIIGTDSDIDTSGVDVIDTLTMTDGVIQSHSTRTLPNAAAGTTGVIRLASATEAKAGSNASKALTPDTLASRSVHAVIDVSNSTFSSGTVHAAITHGLGDESVIVQMFDTTTKETVYAKVERKTLAGADSADVIRVTFADAPDNDIEVVITSTKGATVVTPAYS